MSYKGFDGVEKLAETYWEKEAEKAQNKEVPVWIDDAINWEYGETKTILLFGGTGGLGSELAKLLKFTPEGLENKVIGLGSSTNICESEQINSALKTYRPDVVINLAAINIDGKIEKTTDQELGRMLNVNAGGAFKVLSETVHFWNDNNIEGRFIYISSVLSQRPGYGASLYSATKAFNDNLVKTAALENSKKGHTFNSIVLGFFEGGMCDRLPDNVKEAALKKIPCHRFGKIKELNNAVQFIIYTPYLNGTNLILDGGYTL